MEHSYEVCKQPVVAEEPDLENRVDAEAILKCNSCSFAIVVIDL